MATHFPAEPGTRCDYCTALASRKYRIMRKIAGKRNARATTGLSLYACDSHHNTARRNAEQGIPR